jgi:hypothetical protein
MNASRQKDDSPKQSAARSSTGPHAAGTWTPFNAPLYEEQEAYDNLPEVSQRSPPLPPLERGQENGCKQFAEALADPSCL